MVKKNSRIVKTNSVNPRTKKSGSIKRSNKKQSSKKKQQSSKKKQQVSKKKQQSSKKKQQSSKKGLHITEGLFSKSTGATTVQRMNKVNLDKLIYTQLNDDWQMNSSMTNPMNNLMNIGGGNNKPINIDKEVKKLIPNINNEFVDLYFAVKTGMYHYKAKNQDTENVELNGEEVGRAIVDIAKKQLNNKLSANDKTLLNIVEGINYGKKSGSDETVNNILKYAKVFNTMFEKRKEKKGDDYSIKRFSNYLIKLLVKILDAEQEVVSKYTSK